MGNTLRRGYLGSDARMLEASEEIHDLFVDDVADFTAFDSELDASFATTWLGKIDAALGFKSDDTVVEEQKGKTGTVGDAMQDGIDAYHDIVYFAEKAFKTDKTTFAQFGTGAKYRRASASQSAMVEFLEEMIGIVDTHKTALLAKGCPQPTIDALTTKAEALRDFNIDQNIAIDTRPQTTKERVTDLNDAFDPMAQVINAAQRIYKTNPEKLATYSYDPSISHGPASKLYRGQLNPGEQRNIVSSGINSTKTLIIANTSAKTNASVIRVDIAANPTDSSPDGVELKAQHRIKVNPGDLPVLPFYYLNMRNLSTTKKASYRIRVRDAG